MIETIAVIGMSVVSIGVTGCATWLSVQEDKTKERVERKLEMLNTMTETHSTQIGFRNTVDEVVDAVDPGSK